MAATGSNQGENDTTGYDYQLETLVFWVDRLWQKRKEITHFDIGSAVNGKNIPNKHAFDDVVFHAEYNGGEKIIKMIQVKHSAGMIDQAYLCEKKRTNVLKYFKSFLSIKPHVELDELEELVIWTNMRIATNIEDWFEAAKPFDNDLLEGNSTLKYRRLKLKSEKFKDISKDFLDLVHPREALIEKFVNALFKKEEWTSKRAAKDFYRVMAREVIECNGPNSKFKQRFIDEQGLLPETVRFRERFEACMKERFSEKKLGAFAMSELNSAEYATHFQLKVDADFKEGNDPNVQWKAWGNVAEQNDLDEFGRRFTFYVQLPEENDFKTHLSRNVDHFDDMSKLLEKSAFRRMISKKQVEKIVALLHLRNIMKCGSYIKLKFGDLDELSKVVEKYLSEWKDQPFLRVKGIQDVECTLSRVITVIENLLAPLSKSYLVQDINSLRKHKDALKQITSDDLIAENGLKCLIITSVNNSRQEQDARTLLNSIKVPIILVGNNLRNSFEDYFDVSKLSELYKKEIFDTEICLSDLQTSTAKDVLQEELFLKENFPIVLALHKKPIRIESNLLIRHDNFISRKIKINGNDVSKIFGNDHLPQEGMSNQTERSIKIDGNNISEIIGSDNFSHIVISDQAGMGKSTEMINIALDLREHEDYSNHLVVYFECKKAKDYLKCDISTTICKMVKASEKAHELLIKCMIRRRKVILLLDGIDETSASGRQDLENMLINILNLHLFKVLIATRPHFDEFLKNIFHNMIVWHLTPFSEEDQLEYLTRFWKIDEIDDEKEYNQAKENAKGLINRFRSMLKDGLLIGIPMQTHMMAVIYQESIRSFNFDPPQPYTIGLIYKKFVDFKYRDLIKRQFRMESQAEENAISLLDQNFIPDHIEISVKIYCNAPETELENLCSQAQMYGIVRLVPSVGFVHHTYFEYFLTLYFLTYKTDASEEFVSFMSQNLCSSRLSIATKFLDHHIEEINPHLELSSKIEVNKPKSHGEEEEVISNSQLVQLVDRLVRVGSLKSKGFEPPSTARLHPDKLREFNYYLEQVSALERYTLIRNALNQSVFNVFEVLYDSLPQDTKNPLKFCFGNKTPANFVNLKILGGNQMLQLLSILLKKNPNNFVRKYLIDFSDEEEDYLEVTCRKPFAQVLMWLIDDLITTIEDQEREALINYINRRFDKYFQLVVQHNNAAFLEEAIKRAKTLWSTNVVNNFLIERNVMNLFLENIEIECGTKKIIVEKRIKMVSHMYNLFHWASSGKIVLSQNCTTVINGLTNPDIQSAFRNQFQNQ